MSARFTGDAEEAFAAWLLENPSATVLFAGASCPYSARFAPHFEAVATGATAVRVLVERHDEGWARHGIRVTPTVVAYRDGKEHARVAAFPLLGLTRDRFDVWWTELQATR